VQILKNTKISNVRKIDTVGVESFHSGGPTES